MVSLYSNLNFGITSIADYLTCNQKEVISVYLGTHPFAEKDLLSNKSINKFIALLKNEKIDIVGFSFTSSYFKEAIRIAAIIKKDLGIYTIFGGWHSTICPEECVNYCDIVCVGEGEETLLEIVEAIENKKPLEAIKGIWFKINGKVFQGEPRLPIDDLDSIYKNINFDRKAFYIGCIPDDKLYYSLMGRGCPFKCSFCNNTTLRLLYGKTYVRSRSIDNVINELNRAKEHFPNLTRIVFSSEVWPYRDEKIDTFCQKYSSSIKLPFWTYLHIHMCDRTILKKLSDAGLESLQTGIQSGCEKTRHRIYFRPETNEKVKEVTKIAEGLNLPIMYDFILSPLIDSEESLRESARFFITLGRKVQYRFFMLAYLSKTILTENLIHNNLIKKEDQEQYKICAGYRWLFNFLRWDFKNERTYYYYLIFLITKTNVSLRLCEYFLKKRNFVRLIFMLLIIFSYVFYSEAKSTVLKLFMFVLKPTRKNFRALLSQGKKAVLFYRIIQGMYELFYAIKNREQK